MKAATSTLVALVLVGSTMAAPFVPNGETVVKRRGGAAGTEGTRVTAAGDTTDSVRITRREDDQASTDSVRITGDNRDMV